VSEPAAVLAGAMAGHEIGFEEPPQACRPISGLIPNKAGFAAFEVRAGSIRATRHGLRQDGLVRQGDRRRAIAHTVVNNHQESDAGRGEGSGRLIAPLVTQVIVVESTQ
jgi:hypothetical protein